MAVQVSYPGVYIEEFTPGAPIQGVGTNTAAFIGTASRGPIEAPTLIQSWDAFESRFGGFIAEQPTSYLAPAVYGFFLNGGTTCYIVRAGTGQMATASLDSRQGGGNPDPILVAQALEEGPGGNAISIRVVDNSLLTLLLGKAGESDVDLALWRAEADILTISEPDRRELTVSDNGGFAQGDRILLTKNGDTATAIVSATRRTVTTQTVVLMAPVAGTVDFGGGTVRTADLTPGQRTLRLDMPDNLRLNQALPRGAAVSITLGSTSEIRTVESSGGDTITLTEGLTNLYSLESATTLPRVGSLEFDLFVDDASGNVEIFELLSMHADHPNYWSAAVESELVTLTEPDEPPDPTPADPRPAAATYNLAGGTADNRLAARAALIANPNDFLNLLKPYDEVALVCVPGATDAAVQQAIIAHCEAMYDRFAILDSIRGATPGNGIRDQFADVRSERGFAALYYPWILARNPLTGRNELWPPSGHIAGVYARTDAQRGVHKAPANTNIRGALGVERLLTNEEHGPLNLMGINVLRVFPEQAQPLVWGARTTATDRNWQYVNVRRLFLFLEESIEEGIRWAVFEPNNLQLWQKLKRTITEFLTRVWRDGALFGATPKDAFYVRIDEVLNPPSTQALGRLYIEIGVRPAYPAEFIIMRIGIWQGDSEVSET
jgi:phage tail sheath protein FI